MSDVAMRDKIKPIPKFTSIEAELEFWDTRDATEYFAPEDYQRLTLERKKVQLVHIYVAPDGSRWEMRKLAPKRPAFAHYPSPSRSKSRNKKAQTRREPFLIG